MKSKWLYKLNDNTNEETYMKLSKKYIKTLSDPIGYH